jgi:hypothetical protein
VGEGTREVAAAVTGARKRRGRGCSAQDAARARLGDVAGWKRRGHEALTGGARAP